MDTIEVEGKEYRFDSLPNRCPQCHHAIDPRILARLMRSYEPMGSAVAEVVFQCPQKTCRRAFIGRYTSSSFRFTTKQRQRRCGDSREVVGCGYRKALEFLIKDYCILQQPSRAEEIKSKFLGRVIEDHIDDQNIKACAKRATWLGTTKHTM